MKTSLRRMSERNGEALTDLFLDLGTTPFVSLKSDRLKWGTFVGVVYSSN